LEAIDDLIGYTENKTLIRKENMEYNKKMDELGNELFGKVKNKV
jgi:hypothetical protein